MKHNIMHGLHVEWLFDLSVGAQQNQRPGIQKQHDVPFEGELHPWLIRFWWRFGLLGITLMICSSQISSRWRGGIIVSGNNQGTIVIIRIGVHDKVRVGLFVFVPASWNERPTWRKAGGKTLNTQGFQHTCLHCAKISTSRTLSSQTIFQCAVDKCWVRNKGKTPVGEPARAIGFSECRASLHWPDTFQIWNWDHKMTTFNFDNRKESRECYLRASMCRVGGFDATPSAVTQCTMGFGCNESAPGHSTCILMCLTQQSHTRDGCKKTTQPAIARLTPPERGRPPNELGCHL